MIRSTASKAFWLGKATVFLVGLAIILAMVLGVATRALGANGDPWILGQGNTATVVTRLAGAVGVDGPMLRLINNNAGANATALDLNVEPGKTPMRVNSDTKVANLNADKLDGKDESDFQAANAPAGGALTGNYPNPSLADNVVRTLNIVDNSVLGVDLADFSVTSDKIANGNVQNADLANNAVNSDKIQDGQVQNADIANSAVNSAKIQDGQVQNADLGNSAVNSDKIANGSVARVDTSVFDTITFIDPPSIAAGSCFTDVLRGGIFSNVQVGDVGYTYPLASVSNGLMVQTGIRQSVPGDFQYKICNVSNAAIDDGQRVYGVRLVR